MTGPSLFTFADPLLQETVARSVRLSGKARSLLFLIISGLGLAVLLSHVQREDAAVQEPTISMGIQPIAKARASQFAQPARVVSSRVWQSLPSLPRFTQWARGPLSSQLTSVMASPANRFVESNGATTNARPLQVVSTIERPEHLKDFMPSLFEFPSPLIETRGAQPASFVSDSEAVLASSVVQVDSEMAMRSFLRAGPRQTTVFDPKTVRAAIVTCGGICPGLNTVIRELVECLWKQYGVHDILGVKSGYKGIAEMDMIPLDPQRVDNIHREGGTILGSSRGHQDVDLMVDQLIAKGVNQVFVVGGDGTIRGASRIAETAKARGQQLAVGVVPKTIDNDIPLIDKSFGFESAVAEASKAIAAAAVEINSFPNGLAVVRVMGRHSGFIATHASLAARNVDLCLVPEQPFYLEGSGGVLEYIEERISTQGHALVVVGEGAGQDLIAKEMRKAAGSSGPGRDASGNVQQSGDIGQWLFAKLKDGLAPKFKDAGGLSLKYIDPTYMIRAVPANPADNIYCAQLAHACVHGVMHGFTNFMVGTVSSQDVYLPLPLVVGRSNIVAVRAGAAAWDRLLFATGQPTFSNPPIPPECMEETEEMVDCELPPYPEECDPDDPETPSGGCTSQKQDDRLR